MVGIELSGDRSQPFVLAPVSFNRHLTPPGLSQHTWMLSFARLARIQCLTLSNGMTSGIPNMDYYVSTISSQGPKAQVGAGVRGQLGWVLG